MVVWLQLRRRLVVFKVASLPRCLDAQELIRYFRKNQVDTDQGMIQKVKGMSVDEAVSTIRTKILQRFRGNEASTRAAFRLFDKDGGGEVSVRSRSPTPARCFCDSSCSIE